MKVPTDFGDPLSETARALQDELSVSRSADTAPAYLTDVEVVTELPGNAPPATPLLVVAQDVWTAHTPGVSAEARIRIIPYNLDPDAAYDLGRWAQAHLLARRGDASINSWRYDSGPRRGRDPDNKVPIAPLAIRVRMRPRIL